MSFGESPQFGPNSHPLLPEIVQLAEEAVTRGVKPELIKQVLANAAKGAQEITEEEPDAKQLDAINRTFQEAVEALKKLLAEMN